MNNIKQYLIHLGYALRGITAQKENWFWEKIEELERDVETLEKRLNDAKKTKKLVVKQVSKK